MTEKEILEEIIIQNGGCMGISCTRDNCPLYGKSGCHTNSSALNLAKEMLGIPVIEEPIKKPTPRSVQKARIQRRVNQRLIRSIKR